MMKELKEALRKIGLELLGEAVPVPNYECGVRAGLPTETGNTPDGWMYIPEEMVRAGVTITVRVIGESMIDYDFREGDHLAVQCQPTAQSGDIVIAMINGAMTVKTYFEDDDGSKWLIPGNPEFTPIQLSPDDDNRITGVVKQIIHESPRTPYRDCARAIRQCRKERRLTVGDMDIARGLKAAAEVMEERKMSGSRPWFAVYRTLTDLNVLTSGDYEGFVSLLERIMQDDAPSISVKDIRQNLDVQSFTKPVSMWSPDDAPVGSRRYYDLIEIAKATKKAIVTR